MDNTIYGFNHNPFATSPGPRSVFPHEAYRGARSSLEYALMDGTGMVVIAGEQGTGKHTLIKDLLSRYPLNDLEVGQCSAADDNHGELLSQVASAFGIRLSKQDDDHAIPALKQYLDKKHAEKKKALLVIQNADNLDIEDLEKLRAVKSRDDHSSAALRIYLLGLPGIQQLINDFTDKHPQGDAVTHIHLGPMHRAEETRAYIEQHLRDAGWEGRPELADDALSLLHSCSRGIPGTIDPICFRLLENGNSAGKTRLDAADVERAAEQVGSGSVIDAAIESADSVANSSEEEHEEGPAKQTTPAPPPPAPRKRRRKRKKPRPAAVAAPVEKTENDPPFTIEPVDLTGIRPEPDIDMVERQHAPVTKPRTRKPEHKGGRWGGMLLVVLFIVLVIVAGAYWDLSNARRLMQIEPIAEALHALGIVSLLPQAGDPPMAVHADAHTLNRNSLNTMTPDTGETFSSPTEDSMPAQSLPVQQQEALSASQPPEADTGERVKRDEVLAIANREGDAAGQQTSLPASSSVQSDTAGQLESEQPDGLTPDISDPGPANLGTGIDTEEARAELEEPTGPRITLLLPTGSSQRFIDLALKNRGRGLIITPELGTALQPYADRLLWQRDGTLQVIPKGLNTLTGEYAPLELQESVDGIAFVIRNFRGVGLLIRQTAGGMAQQRLPSSALELVESRLRNKEFAMREVPLVKALSANTITGEPAPLYLLVVPHR